MSDVVTFATDGRVGTITLANPPANPLGDAILDGLDAAVAAAREAEVKAVVVESAIDGFFAAGADIKKMVDLGREDFERYHHKMRGTFAHLAAGPFVSVAAIDGIAFGGGLELALTCTMRVASAGAKLGVPESKLGLLPAATGTQRLPRVVGRARALDLMLTARSVRGEEALAMGLVDRLVEDPKAGAQELAADLARLSLPALQAIQRCVDASLDLTYAEGLQVETEEFLGLVDHGEVAEGLRAFLEKRPPRFA